MLVVSSHGAYCSRDRHVFHATTTLRKVAPSLGALVEISLQERGNQSIHVLVSEKFRLTISKVDFLMTRAFGALP